MRARLSSKSLAAWTLLRMTRSLPSAERYVTSPYSAPHLVYVSYSRLVGISSKLPMMGRGLGPGGREGRVPLFLHRWKTTKVRARARVKGRRKGAKDRNEEAKGAGGIVLFDCKRKDNV